MIDNELTNSFKEALGKRLTTPIYGTFFISWLIFHWEFAYTMFFVGEEKIFQATKLLKNDYLTQTFFNLSDPYFYISWIAPFILTWLIIWQLPEWISIPAFKKEEKDKTTKKLIRIQEQKRLELEQGLLEEVKTKKLEEVSKQAKEKKKIEKIDPTIKWEEEYQQFQQMSYYKDFNRLLESVYEYGGKTSWFPPNSGYSISIPKTLLAYTHTGDLIEFSNSKESITLTEKGKFFVKRFSLDKN